MRRIHFSPASIAKVSSTPNLDPIQECLFALENFATGSGGPFFHAWRKRVAARREIRMLTELALTLRPFPDLHRIRERDSVKSPSDAFRPRVLRDLDAFHQVAVQPYWAEISKLLEVDRRALSRWLAGVG